MKVLFFGFGYCAGRFATLAPRFATYGATRGAAGLAAMRAAGIEGFRFDAEGFDPGLPGALDDAEALVVSIPPSDGADAALAHFGREIAAASQLRRIVYLSTIGVYGDYGGAWVDETSPALTRSERGLARLAAEAEWAQLGEETGVAVDILRLAGIYGPGRNALEKLARGEARRIVKPGHVFNRTHVDDIAGLIALALETERPGAIWNVADDEPAPPQDVLLYAAGLLGLPPPPEETFDPASMSAMSASFYVDNKRVSIARAKAELGWRLKYPTYREGLDALAAAGEGRTG